MTAMHDSLLSALREQLARALAAAEAARAELAEVKAYSNAQSKAYERLQRELASAREALSGLAERPNGYHDCSDYERGYGDAWAAKANMAVDAIKNLDAALASNRAHSENREDGAGKEGRAT